MKSAITPGIASAIERPIHRGVYRPFGGSRRKSLSRRFADILKGRTAIVYDPQDLTTLFQDAAGTLPVYRPGTGQVDPPVGLGLDKSQRLELGPELWDGVLTATNGGSGANGVYDAVTGELINTVVGTQTYVPAFVGPLNRLELNKFYRVKLKFSGNLDPLTSVTLHSSSSTPAFAVGGVGGAAILAANGEFEYIGVNITGNPGLRINTDGTTTWSGLFIEEISIREIKGYHAYQTTTTARPTLSGRYSLLTATETLSTQSITTAATNYTLSFSGTGTVTLGGTATGTYSAGTHTITCTAGTLTCTVAGSVTRADLRASNDGVGLPPYQRVDSAMTYDTAGFPLYLRFDGVDDFLQTASVDLTSMPPVCLGIGVRKTGNSGVSDTVFETGVTAKGSLSAFASSGGTNSYLVRAFGLDNTIGTQLVSPSAYVPPSTNVLVAQFSNISQQHSLSVDGVRTEVRVGTISGTLANTPIYVGSRGGTSLRLNGRIYSICIIGSLLSTSEQAVLERYLNAKTRAY